MSWFSQLIGLTRRTSLRKDGVGRSSLAARRRDRRVGQRELLHKVVRDSMIGMGFLSSQFKFKVLSLDEDGLQFVVMIDLSDQFDREFGALVDMEVTIAQRAESLHRKLKVKSIYWRLTDANLVKPPAKRGKVIENSGPAYQDTADERPTLIAVTASGFPLTELPDGSLPHRPLGTSQYGDLL